MTQQHKIPPIALVQTWLHLLKTPDTQQHAARMLLGAFDNLKAAEHYVMQSTNKINKTNDVRLSEQSAATRKVMSF